MPVALYFFVLRPSQDSAILKKPLLTCCTAGHQPLGEYGAGARLGIVRPRRDKRPNRCRSGEANWSSTIDAHLGCSTQRTCGQREMRTIHHPSRVQKPGWRGLFSMQTLLDKGLTLRRTRPSLRGTFNLTAG
jgi:hypothetical protein